MAKARGKKQATMQMQGGKGNYMKKGGKKRSKRY
jgi:hypothetical protein